jgi:hypothetical protein
MSRAARPAGIDPSGLVRLRSPQGELIVSGGGRAIVIVGATVAERARAFSRVARVLRK